MVAPTSGLRGLQASRLHKSGAKPLTKAQAAALPKTKGPLPKVKAGKRDLRDVALQASSVNREKDVPKANF
jgi:hypothetical protein